MDITKVDLWVSIKLERKPGHFHKNDLRVFSPFSFSTCVRSDGIRFLSFTVKISEIQYEENIISVYSIYR